MSDFSPESNRFEDSLSRHFTPQHDRYDLSDSLSFYVSTFHAYRNKLKRLDLGIDSEDIKILLAASAFSLSVTGLLLNSDEVLSIVDSGKAWVTDRFESLTQPFGRVR